MSEHSKLRAEIKKAVSGLENRSLREHPGASKYSAGLRAIGDKSGAVVKYLEQQGFEPVTDPMKTEAFYGRGGQTLVKGKFYIQIETFGSGRKTQTWVTVTDQEKSASPIWF